MRGWCFAASLTAVVSLCVGPAAAQDNSVLPEVRRAVNSAYDAEVMAFHIFLDLLGYETGAGEDRTPGLLIAFSAFYQDYLDDCFGAREAPGRWSSRPRRCVSTINVPGDGPAAALRRTVEDHDGPRRIEQALRALDEYERATTE